MKRLTKWFGEGANRVAGVADDLEEKYTPEEIIDILLAALAPYEDTGLEPEDMNRVFNEDAVLKFAAQILGTTADHLRELVQAEQDGRLAVLPCKEFYEKIGDFLYLIDGGEITEVLHGGAEIDVNGKPTIIVVAEDNIFSWREPIAEFDTEPADWCVNTKVVTSDDFGKTVFLTREEAETALEAQKGGGEADA